MGRKVVNQVEIGGITVEICEPISKDGGLVVVAQHIRTSTWFQPLVDRLLSAMACSPKPTHGFDARPKLEAGLLALIAGLVMGRRNPNAIAESFALDPLWKAVAGRRFIQRELSRLVEVLASIGEAPLRRALLDSALAGQDHLELDMDSSVLELHGLQECGSYNAHYHTFGYHADWAIDIRTGKLAALWLNEGKANTAEGQADQLTWIFDRGARVTLARFDAGLIGPDMLQAIDGRVDRFVCRIRSNTNLDKLADPLEPPGPLYAGAKSYAEFRYAADTWDKQQRVVVRFQAPNGADGEKALFPGHLLRDLPTHDQVEEVQVAQFPVRPSSRSALSRAVDAGGSGGVPGVARGDLPCLASSHLGIGVQGADHAFGLLSWVGAAE